MYSLCGGCMYSLCGGCMYSLCGGCMYSLHVDDVVELGRYVKVKQSHYRPGVVQRVPAS